MNWHVLQYIPIRFLSVWHALCMYCVVYLVSIQYVLNTNKLYANTDWYVLNTYYLLILNS